MFFENNHIYHIYNQGNNRQKIFFNDENKYFFLRKIKEYILPYADILAWCLMPNHFHIMVYVRNDRLTLENDSLSLRNDSLSSRDDSLSLRNDSLSSRETIISNRETIIINPRSFNDSIGYMIRSYTQAVNKQNNTTGSVFRAHTKSEDLTKPQGISPSFFGNQIAVYLPEKEYPQVCFNYIHNNPVKAKMVSNPEDYEFSSYRDFAGLRNGKLISKERAKEFGLFILP